MRRSRPRVMAGHGHRGQLSNPTRATARSDRNLPLTNWTIRTNGTLVLSGNAAISTHGDGWTWPSWAAIESNTCDGTIRSEPAADQLDNPHERHARPQRKCGDLDPR